MRSPLEFTGITQKYSLGHRAWDMGWNSRHGGQHAPVYAAADGIVVYNRWLNKKSGYVIGIYHPEYDVTTEYGHIQEDSQTIREGYHVKKGQHICNMGNTGSQGGEPLPFHLHFGICKGRGLNYSVLHKWYNPKDYINIYDDQSISKDDKDYVKHTKKVTAKDGLNIRTQPSTKGKIVGVAKYNEQVECYGTKNGWNCCDNFNKYYCSGNYLR